MSCNIYEEPRFNLAERRQADGGERLEQPVEIYESANGLDIHLGHVARRKGGAPVEKPFPVGKRNWFRPALLLLALLNLLLLLAVVILSALYVHSLQWVQHQEELLINQILCHQDRNNIPAGSYKGWMRFGCSCYYRSEEQRNWTESRRQCQSSGGDLVSIQTREEEKFVNRLNGNGTSWIGLYLVDGWTEKWLWVDGSTYSYTNWRKEWQKKSGESKVFINSGGLWDTASTVSKHWICEKPI